MSEVEKLLTKIVEVQQRIYDRYAEIRRSYREKNPGEGDAVGDGEMDAAELELLKTQLELAKYKEKP